jgi:hypothetical protein
METQRELDVWLESFLAQNGGTSGTVHVQQGGGLHLASAINIPPQVQEVVRYVPNGKGMAGLALQRRECVTTCNLKEDKSGNVKPGAKAVDARGAVAIPVEDGAGGVRAVVGIAFMEQRDFTPADLDALARSASSLPRA